MTLTSKKTDRITLRIVPWIVLRTGSGIVLRALAAVLLMVVSGMAAEDDKDAVERKAGANAFAVDEANFDQWVFQGSSSGEAGRNRLRAFLTLRIDELQRTCALTPAQSQKLLLAGHGDLKRFLDQVEVVRQKFLKVRQDQDQFNRIWQDINPLQQKQATGIFGKSSLIEKTIQNTLTPEQRQQWLAVEGERRKYRYSAAIETSVLSMGTLAGLSPDQHDALVALLETTEPPLVFGQYDTYYVNYALSRIPAQKLRKIITNDQWKHIQQRVAQGRGMEQFLAQNGVIKGVAAAPQGNGLFGVFFGPVFGQAPIAVAAPAMAVEAMPAEAVEVIGVDVNVGDDNPAHDPDGSDEPVPSALHPENRHEPVFEDPER